MKTLILNLFKTCIFSLFIGILSHIIGERISRENLRWDRFPYKAHHLEKEGRIYESIHISRWKNKVPDMSRIANDMYEKKLGLSRDPEQVLRLVQESCVAEFIHLLLIFISPFLLLFTEEASGFWIALLYAATNIPFIMIQRYNRPKLLHLYDRILEKARKEKESTKNESFDFVM